MVIALAAAELAAARARAECREPVAPRHWMMCYCGNLFLAGQGDGCNCSVACSDRWKQGCWFDLDDYQRRVREAA
jgi:hypothetical protein